MMSGLTQGAVLPLLLLLLLGPLLLLLPLPLPLLAREELALIASKAASASCHCPPLPSAPISRLYATVLGATPRRWKSLNHPRAACQPPTTASLLLLLLLRCRSRAPSAQSPRPSSPAVAPAAAAATPAVPAGAAAAGGGARSAAVMRAVSVQTSSGMPSRCMRAWRCTASAHRPALARLLMSVL